MKEQLLRMLQVNEDRLFYILTSPLVDFESRPNSFHGLVPFGKIG